MLLEPIIFDKFHTWNMWYESIKVNVSNLEKKGQAVFLLWISLKTFLGTMHVQSYEMSMFRYREKQVLLLKKFQLCFILSLV